MIDKIVFTIAMLPVTAGLGALVYFAFIVNIVLGLLALWVSAYAVAIQVLSEHQAESRLLNRPHSRP